jgi:hypothetical protein
VRNRWWPRSPLRAVDCARSRRRTARRASARVNSEADLIWVLAHDLDRDRRGLGDLLTGTPAVGEDRLDERENAARDSQKRFATVAIMNARRMRFEHEPRPSVSTSAWRLRPLTFLPAS